MNRDASTRMLKLNGQWRTLGGWSKYLDLPLEEVIKFKERPNPS